MTTSNTLLQNIENIARDAGEVMMEIYQKDFSIYEKDDKSPLTEADLAAHNVIKAGLVELEDDFPLLSEESANIPWETRKNWQTYWLVDPLDGTKEFIKKNDEFTVNIALIQDGNPTLGVVYVPATGVMYSGIVGEGAYKTDANGKTPITTTPYETGTCIVMGSRSHQSDAIKDFLKDYPDHELVPAGSSLKFCRVAEGSAHIYPRLGPTSEWDTGAAHAVLKAAGGEVVEFESRQPLRYNQKDEYLNPFFIAKG